MSKIRQKLGDALFQLFRPSDRVLRKALGEASLFVDDEPSEDESDLLPIFGGIGDIKRYFFEKQAVIPHELYSSEIENGVNPPAESSDYFEAYMNNTWAFRCVNVIAQSAACVPFRAEKRDRKAEKPEWKWDDDCALAGLIEEPNNLDNTFEFIEGTLINLEAVGNAFWLIERMTGRESSLPMNLHNIRADRVKIVPKGKSREVKQYEYMRITGKNGPVWKPSEMVHLSLFHPTNPFFGLSPMSPALIPLILEFWVQAYNKAFFKNSGRLDAVLETDNILSKIAFRRAKRMIKRFVGPKKAHQLAILEDGLKYKPVQAAPKDAEWSGQRKQNMTEIMATWGVVPIMLGLTDRTPWANAKEQKRVFWENTMTPVMTRLAFWFNKRISSEYNDEKSPIQYRARFDYSNVAALKEDRQVLAEVLATLVKWRVLTINEARQELNKDEVPWGNQPILPTKEEENTPDYPTRAELASDIKSLKAKLLQQAGIGEELTEAILFGKIPTWMRDASTVVDFSPSHSPPGGDGGSAEDLLSDFRRAVGRWTPKYAMRSERALRWLLDREEKRLTSPTNIKRLKAWAAGDLQWPDLGFDHDSWVAYLRKNGGYPLFAKIIKQFGDDTLIGIGRAVASIRKQSTEFDKAKREIGGIGVDFDLLDPNVKSYMQSKPMRFASDLTGGTFERLAGELQVSFTEGLREGESTQQLTARTQDIFANTRRALPARATNIARTEVGSASNFAIGESYSQSGAVKSRQWISVQKPSTREKHRKAHGQVAKLGQPFTVWGEKLQFPGDPAGSAKNVCQCLCSTKAVLGEPEAMCDVPPRIEPLKPQLLAQQAIDDVHSEALSFANELGRTNPAAMAEGFKSDLVSEAMEESYERYWTAVNKTERVNMWGVQDALYEGWVSGTSSEEAAIIKTSVHKYLGREVVYHKNNLHGSAMREAMEYRHARLGRLIDDFGISEAQVDRAIIYEAKFNQEWAKAIYGGKVRVSRGVTKSYAYAQGEEVGDKLIAAATKKGGKATVRTNAASSWTIDDGTAAQFAGEDGFILQADIPTNQLLKWLPEESEMVMAGGDIKASFWNIREFAEEVGLLSP